MFLDEPFIMAGDFNLPLLTEENGLMKLSENTKENYPLDESSFLGSIWSYITSFFYEDNYEYMNRNGWTYITLKLLRESVVRQNVHQFTIHERKVL